MFMVVCVLMEMRCRLFWVNPETHLDLVHVILSATILTYEPGWAIKVPKYSDGIVPIYFGKSYLKMAFSIFSGRT
jgi:hypothetical protein